MTGAASAGTDASAETGWRPKLIALDVDGTILGYDESLSPAVAAAVTAVRAAGIRTVIATGRSLHGTLDVCRMLGMADGPVVCSNGAVIADVATGQPTDVVTFDPTDSVRFFADQVPDATLAVEEIGVGYRLTGEFPAGELTGRFTVVSHDQLVQGPVSRLIVRWAGGEREHLFRLAREAGLEGVDYAIGYSAWLDFMPAGVSKASALELVAERAGASAADVLAVGDGHNDLEMLTWAGHGVAMGHAPEDVRDSADEVCAPVAEDGLADVLNRYA